jgi:hypothetical protein
MRKPLSEARQVFRQFAWHLVGKLALKTPVPAPKGKR